MELKEAPVAEAGMLIRRPAAEVFEAIVDPAVTTKFWFTHSSGRLDEGKPVEWEWRMYGVSTRVEVSEIVPNEKIVMQWSDPPTTIVWTFTKMPGETTFLEVRNFGFAGSGEITLEAWENLTERLEAASEQTMWVPILGGTRPRSGQCRQAVAFEDLDVLKGFGQSARHRQPADTRPDHYRPPTQETVHDYAPTNSRSQITARRLP